MGLNKRLIDQAGAVGAAGTDNFEPVIYSGNGTSAGSVNTITGVGFQPDLVWIKNRDNANDHFLTDSVRGAGAYISSNNTDAEDTTDRFDSFDSNGFTVSTDTALLNNSSYNYVSWCWKAGGTAVSNTDGSVTSSVSANQEAGFSIVKFTAPSSSNVNFTAGHGLSTTPEIVFTKVTSRSGTWHVWSQYLSNTLTNYLKLNDTNAEVTFPNMWGTGQTSSVISLRSDASTYSGEDHIAYCFHSVDGYQKVGSFTGDGNTSQDITTDFQPRFLLVKDTSASSHWFLYDSERGVGENTTNVVLPNNSTSELTGREGVEFLSNGFRMYDGDNFNINGNTILYLAIA